MAFRFGRPADVPLAGDWNGDGRDTIGVRRGDAFLLRNRNGSGPANVVVRFGRTTDRPLAGDWNGDGRDTIGVRRGNRFFLSNRLLAPRTARSFRFGRGTDQPLVGDWNGDGRDTIGLRRGKRVWLSNALRPPRAHARFPFGRRGDLAQAGDRAGRGRDTVWLMRAPTFRSSWGPLPADVRKRMIGVSWRRGCPVALRGLALVEVRRWGFDRRPHMGRLIVAKDVAEETVGVFRDLFAARFPIERMRPVDVYGGSDAVSMRRNNTSAFNCRPVTGGTGWSQHAYGTAIDVNPVQNPYVRGDTVLPTAGQKYLDRNRVRAGMVTSGDAVTTAFARRGWAWGGAWTSLKDYQHFSPDGG